MFVAHAIHQSIDGSCPSSTWALYLVTSEWQTGRELNLNGKPYEPGLGAEMQWWMFRSRRQIASFHPRPVSRSGSPPQNTPPGHLLQRRCPALGYCERSSFRWGSTENNGGERIWSITEDRNKEKCQEDLGFCFFWSDGGCIYCNNIFNVSILSFPHINHSIIPSVQKYINCQSREVARYQPRSLLYNSMQSVHCLQSCSTVEFAWSNTTIQFNVFSVVQFKLDIRIGAPFWMNGQWIYQLTVSCSVIGHPV